MANTNTTATADTATTAPADGTADGRPTGAAGAVANALDTLVGRGEAVLTCERPRRFRAANPATNDADTGSGDADSTPAA